ncbi:PREDICTED: RBBP8 N-terminal-like protein [Dipodomys ordii]|uniref:RBBP8 N-terminal-like protein n=1 Tax=Dipodomys ordii TaxID=10020 RepID=A0A1S3GC25_DIPOR|nr:PREDICTED: RBBP8 N-terminal-like protein [Dipodomys ordii]
MESFMESLNRLRDVHEKEVLGLQSKLLELNSERCREAQRVEELFAKNHQLREQQKVLKENLRALENRLRAGLCDRCKVTQELARKKQLELESAHLQSLQHLCVLTKEMNGLKEENKMLKEEVKRLRGLEDRAVPVAREGTPGPPSPLLLPSPGSWKTVPQETPAGSGENHTGPGPWGEEKPTGHRTSPGTNLPEPRTPDMSPQRISNQLHATVAVVRPGSRACPADCGPSGRTSPPTTTRSSPASPVYEHSAPLDSFLRASRSSAEAFESLKRSLQADRRCLLNRQLSLRLRSPHGSPLAVPRAPHSPQLQGLKAQDAEAWEEPTGLLGLPSALVGMQDPRLEGALHLLLAQQQLWARARASRLRDSPTPRESPVSPPAGSDWESPGSQVLRAGVGTAVPPGGWHSSPTGPSGLQRKEGSATQDCASDRPLDLSDPARCRDSRPSGQHRPLRPAAAPAPSPEPLEGAVPALCTPLAPGPQACSNGIKGTRVTEREELSIPTVRVWHGPRALLLLPASVCPNCTLASGLHPRQQPSPGGMEGEAGGRLKRGPCPQRTDGDRSPEPSKASVQRPESDALDEPAASHSEADASCEVGTKLSLPVKGPPQDLQQKRKWDLALGDTASKEPSCGKKPRVSLTAAEESESVPSPEDRSPSPGSSGWES